MYVEHRSTEQDQQLGGLAALFQVLAQQLHERAAQLGLLQQREPRVGASGAVRVHVAHGQHAQPRERRAQALLQHGVPRLGQHRPDGTDVVQVQLHGATRVVELALRRAGRQLAQQVAGDLLVPALLLLLVGGIGDLAVRSRRLLLCGIHE